MAELRTSSAEERKANARKLTAEAVKAETEARKELANAEIVELELAKKRYEEQKRLAADEHHYVYRFGTEVSSETVTSCLDRLSVWHRMEPDCEITIVLNSPGGSVIDGMVLFDGIVELRRAGHRVITKAQGEAASIAGILLQAGDERVMSAESWLMIHQASYIAIGSHYKVEDMVRWVDRVQDRILRIFASRASASKAKQPASQAFIKRNWTRKDWWIDADEALKYGFIDRIDSGLEVG